MSLSSDLDSQTVLQKLHDITRELGSDASEDVVKARLQETYPTLTEPHLMAFKRVEVIIISGHVTIETIWTRFRNFTGDCDNKSWGGICGGWFRVDDESASKVVFNAQNTPPTPDRAGGLIIFFKRDQSSPSIATFIGDPISYEQKSTSGSGTITL